MAQRSTCFFQRCTGCPTARTPHVQVGYPDHLSPYCPTPPRAFQPRPASREERLHLLIHQGVGQGPPAGGASLQGLLPDIDERGAHVPDLHWDRGPCSQEDHFWVLAASLYGKTHREPALGLSPDTQEGLGLDQKGQKAITQAQVSWW